MDRDDIPIVQSGAKHTVQIPPGAKDAKSLRNAVTSNVDSLIKGGSLNAEDSPACDTSALPQEAIQAPRVLKDHIADTLAIPLAVAVDSHFEDAELPALTDQVFYEDKTVTDVMLTAFIVDDQSDAHLQAQIVSTQNTDGHFVSVPPVQQPPASSQEVEILEQDGCQDLRSRPDRDRSEIQECGPIPDSGSTSATSMQPCVNEESEAVNSTESPLASRLKALKSNMSVTQRLLTQLDEAGPSQFTEP